MEAISPGHALDINLEGRRLAGVLHLPGAVNPANPLVVLLHGFTGWKEEGHISSLAEALSAAGAAAYRFDAPGSGDSEGTFADDYRVSTYLRSVEPVVAGIRAATPLRGPVGLWGHSLGGFVALSNAVRHPDLFRSVVVSQPSTGNPGFGDDEIAEWRERGWRRFSNTHFPEIDLPFAFLEDRLQHDIRPELHRLVQPSFFIGGTRDTLCPPASVRHMSEIAGGMSQYREWNTTHFYKANQRVLGEINAATVEFFTRTLFDA